MGTVELLTNIIFAWVGFLLALYFGGMAVFAFSDWRKSKVESVRRSSRIFLITFLICDFFAFSVMILLLMNIVGKGVR